MDTKQECWRQYQQAQQRAERAWQHNDRTAWLIADGQASRWLDRWVNAAEQAPAPTADAASDRAGSGARPASATS